MRSRRLSLRNSPPDGSRKGRRRRRRPTCSRGRRAMDRRQSDEAVVIVDGELAAGEPGLQGGPPTQASAAAETRGRRVVGAGLWATGSRLLPQFYSLLMSVVAARFLGPDGMGRQSLIAFAAIFGTTATALGMPAALMRYVGQRVGAGESETLPDLIRVVWKIEAVAAVLGAIVLIGIGLHGAEPRAAWILAGLTCAFGVLQKVPTSVLVGL